MQAANPSEISFIAPLNKDFSSLRNHLIFIAREFLFWKIVQ